MNTLHKNGLRNRYLFALDAVLLTAGVWIAYTIRFEGVDWPPLQRQSAMLFAAIVIPLKLLIFNSQGLYRRLWRHAGVAELEDILQASGIAALVAFVLGGLLLPRLGLLPTRVPISVLFIDAWGAAGCSSSGR